jgi:hypothetical protein
MHTKDLYIESAKNLSIIYEDRQYNEVNKFHKKMTYEWKGTT